MRPVDDSSSDCSLSNISSVSSIPFPFASLTNIFLASARLPLLRSHLGDSGIVLKKLSMVNQDLEMLSVSDVTRLKYSITNIIVLCGHTCTPNAFLIKENDLWCYRLMGSVTSYC